MKGNSCLPIMYAQINWLIIIGLPRVKSEKYFQTIILFLSLIWPTDYALANTNKVVAVEYRLKFFKEALSLLKNDIGRYPTSIEGLSFLMENPENIDNWNGPYLNRNFLPRDSWDNAYIYKYIKKLVISNI